MSTSASPPALKPLPRVTVAAVPKAKMNHQPMKPEEVCRAISKLATEVESRPWKAVAVVRCPRQPRSCAGGLIRAAGRGPRAGGLHGRLTSERHRARQEFTAEQAVRLRADLNDAMVSCYGVGTEALDANLNAKFSLSPHLVPRMVRIIKLCMTYKQSQAR
jgi:hypothetical protein